MHNQRVDRDNLKQFMVAADMACRAIRGNVNGNPRFFDEPGLAPGELEALERLLANIRARSGHARLATILAEVSLGKIPGIRECIVPYVANGAGSWSEAGAPAENTIRSGARFNVAEQFEQSDHGKVHGPVRSFVLEAYHVIQKEHVCRSLSGRCKKRTQPRKRRCRPQNRPGCLTNLFKGPMTAEAV